MSEANLQPSWPSYLLHVSQTCRFTVRLHSLSRFFIACRGFYTIPQKLKEKNLCLQTLASPFCQSFTLLTYNVYNMYQFTCIHLLAIIRFWTRYIIANRLMHMNWCIVCWLADNCLCYSLKPGGIVRSWCNLMDDSCVLIKPRVQWNLNHALLIMVN